MAIKHYDQTTGALIITDQDNYDAHVGRMFYLERSLMLDTGQVYRTAIVTPSGTDIVVHVRWSIQSDAPCKSFIQEDCTCDYLSGDLRFPVNCNRSHPFSPKLTCYGNVPKPTEIGETIHTIRGGYSSKKLRGGLQFKSPYQVLLKQNSVYVWTAKSLAEDNYIYMNGFWTESPHIHKVHEH